VTVGLSAERFFPIPSYDGNCAARPVLNLLAIRFRWYARCAFSRCLTITNTESARCELVVQDDGYVKWDYWPGDGRGRDPEDMTRLISWKYVSGSAVTTSI